MVDDSTIYYASRVLIWRRVLDCPYQQLDRVLASFNVYDFKCCLDYVKHLCLLSTHPAGVLSIFLSKVHQFVCQTLDDIDFCFLQALMLVPAKRDRDDSRLKINDRFEAWVFYLDIDHVPLAEQLDVYLLLPAHLLGFSFLPRTSSSNETPLTLNTCHLTPGMSPIAPPIAPPIPPIITSSCSSTKLSAPSFGRKAVTDLPFFISCTLTHLRTAELGCFDSIPTFSSTMPLACGAPSSGFAFLSSMSILLL